MARAGVWVWRCLGLAAVMVAGLGVASAQETTQSAPKPASPQEQAARAQAFFNARFTKHEYNVPMRDGVKLYTAVYVPVASQYTDPGPYPFLLTRTPYSCAPYGSDKVLPRVTSNEKLIASGYILVCQDVRGRWNSEGSWLEMTPSKDGKGIDESTDTSDTVDWLLKNVPGNNGKVGILGISYPGFYTAASIVDSHPAIKAASPQAPMMDIYMGDDAYHGGAFMLSANHSFYAPFFAPQKNPLTVEPKTGFEFPTQNMYQYYLDMGTLAKLDSPAGGTNALFHDQVIHTTYDHYWQIRNLTPHMHGVHAAVMVVGGWFDAEDLAGPVKVFHAIDKLSPEAPEDSLVEGPWVHGGWARSNGARLGDVSFGSETSVFYRNEIEFPFFEHWLKDKQWTELPKAYTFETGSNVWKKYPAWPPPNAQRKMIYLQANGGLSWDAPTPHAARTST